MLTIEWQFQFLTAMPARLNKSIELGAYTQAIKYYKSSSGVLKRCTEDIPSFRSIERECEQIIQNLRKSLHKQMINPEVCRLYVYYKLTFHPRHLLQV
jgi:hypothetical protein